MKQHNYESLGQGGGIEPEVELPLPKIEHNPTHETSVESDAAKAVERGVTSGLPTPVPMPTSQPADSPVGVPAQPPALHPTTAGTPAIADDNDLIEKEWVMKAKQIVASTKADPHMQNVEMSKYKATYIKKRFNKDVKLTES